MAVIEKKAIDQGFAPERLEHLASVIQNEIDRELYGAASLVVTRNDATVFDGSFGYSDEARKKPVIQRQLYATMSVAKNITVVAFLQRVDRGEIAFTDLVSKHVPEYACRGKERTTVLDLLTQRSGLPKALPLPPELLGNHDANVQAACACLPETEPGTLINYSFFVNHTMLAEIVRRVDGGKRTFRQIVTSDLLKPLGMDETTFGLPAKRRSKIAEVYPKYVEDGVFTAEELVPTASVILDDPKAEFPGAGYFTTALDLSRMARMLCNGGELEGKRFLSWPLVERIHKIETGDARNLLWDYAIGMRKWREMPAHLTPGFFARGDGTHIAPFGVMASPNTIGGMGAGSTCFWVDPERKVTFSLLTAGLLEDSHSLDRHQRLSDLVFSSMVA